MNTRARQALRGLALVSVVTLAGSCGSRPAYVTYDVPRPGAGFNYGLLAMDVATGDTRGARVELQRVGYQPRHVDLRGDGAVVIRLNPGEWKVRVTGAVGAPDVITFGGQQKSKDAGPSAWPQTPLDIEIKPNRLTNAGRVCAHRACTQVWEPWSDPRLDAWAARRRIVEFLGPPDDAPPTEGDPAPEESSK